MSHIQVNYSFVLFWNIFGEIHGNFSFESKKWLSKKEAQNYSESLFFSTSLKRVQIQKKICIFKTTVFFIKPVQKDKY